MSVDDLRLSVPLSFCACGEPLRSSVIGLFCCVCDQTQDQVRARQVPPESRVQNKRSDQLNALRDACHGNAKAKGFHDPEVRPSVGESLALMHSELSEALEDHRKGHAPNEFWYEVPKGFSRCGERIHEPSFVALDDVTGASVNGLAKPCGIPSEMSDVIIRVLDFCGLHNIDIDRAVSEKMAFNATREHRHGGKRL